MGAYVLIRYFCVYTINRGLLVQSNIVDENYNNNFDTLEAAEQAIMENDGTGEYVILPITEKIWRL